MISDNLRTAIEILEKNGYKRDDYQGKNYRDSTGNLNDMMPAAEKMFDEWLPVVIGNWPIQDRMGKIIAQRTAVNAITHLWLIGHILEID